ncbi:MAG: hypothetical protein ABSF62_21480 [Bryobacteraceae bacterium]
MRYFRLIALAALACGLIWGEDQLKRTADGDGSRPTSANVTLPPVLRPTEPGDDVVVTLPGPPAKVTAVVAPVPPPTTIVRKTPPPADLERPILRRPKRTYPDGFEKNAAEYLHQRLGGMTEADAKELLGEALNSRPAYDDDKAVNGRICAYADPTGHFKQLELDFDKQSGQLRTVFVYPLQMTWMECRKTFGANVRATPANKGRTFYSYLNRRMDVLVDPSGKVISLGMY